MNMQEYRYDMAASSLNTGLSYAVCKACDFPCLQVNCAELPKSNRWWAFIR